jgi:hypothetical protein
VTVERLATARGERWDSALEGPISPELVLVDPDLRELVLRSEPDGTEIELGGSATEPDGSAPFPRPKPQSAVAELRERVEEEPAAVTSGVARRRWRGIALAGFCAALAAVGVGFAITGLPDFSGTKSGSPQLDRSARTTHRAGKTHQRVVPPAAKPAKAPTAATPAKSPTTATPAKARKSRGGGTATTPVPRPTKVLRPPTQAPAPRRFAWPPVPGATAYKVAVYKGDVPVFSAQTAHTSIVIPERTRRSGSGPGLEPGTYKWYVWPVHGGRPDGVAVVRSTFVVR